MTPDPPAELDRTSTESHAAHESILYLENRTHVLIGVALVIGGEWVAHHLAPADWGLVKTVVAGLFGATGVYVCLFINRILVSAADDW